MDANFPAGLSLSPSRPPAADTPDPATSAAALTAVLSPAAQDAAIAQYGIAGRVWEAAYALMRYVRAQGTFDPPLRLTAGAVALELGAGTGAAGLALAAAHPLARVLLTDLPGVCPLLRANAPAAAYPNVQVRALAWGCAAHAREVLRAAPPALVLGSDLVYFPALHAPLLRTLLQLTAGADAGARTEVLLAYRVRELQKEAPFWAAFGLWFVFAPVLVQEAGAGGRWTRLGVGSEGDGEVYVFSARRRAESVGWEVPEDDGELLEGVEARGTRARKGDDAFELLLLMGVGE